MEWTNQQARALSEVSRWLRDDSAPQTYKLWGYAGTGKTTIAKELTQDVKTIFLTYTGKAASVLRKKGIPDARTIHSALYDVRGADRARLIELEEELQSAVGEDRAELQKEYEAELERCRRPRFSLNPESVITEYDLIFIDEASMVSGRIAQDLEYFKKKILIAGDPFQLPPVKGSGYYMTGEPDIMLTEIMRQALDNPIIRWSMKVREGEILPFAREGTCRKVMRSKVTPEALFGLDYMVLTGKNETRRALNKQARKLRGFDSVYPMRGERLVMLQNHKDFGVLNGVLCDTLADANPDIYHEFIEQRVHYEGEDKDLLLCTSQFNAYDFPARADDIDFNKRWKTPADFGYALTVHKAQGSQWPGVALVDDGLNKGKGVERNRWIYTAITRAERDLLIVA
jgi:exodeoxyribonuclease-5